MWDQRPAPNLLRAPGVFDFVTRVVRDGVAAGWGHYTALLLDGQTIAWHVGLLDRNELYWWLPAHDPSWESLSPGKVLLSMLIDHGIQQGWTRIHLLTGGHRYKLNWRPEPVELCALRWYSPTMRGRLFSVYDHFRRASRR
jgi:CelD/BcsL family acetyltransferase involved in cellulose biosynthesis